MKANNVCKLRNVLEVSDFFDHITVAWYAARNAYEVKIPENIKSINSFAFGSNNIKQVFIPENIEEISSDAFACNPLKIVYGVGGTEAEKFAKSNGIKFIDVA